MAMSTTPPIGLLHLHMSTHTPPFQHTRAALKITEKEDSWTVQHKKEMDAVRKKMDDEMKEKERQKKVKEAREAKERVKAIESAMLKEAARKVKERVQKEMADEPRREQPPGLERAVATCTADPDKEQDAPQSPSQ